MPINSKRNTATLEWFRIVITTYTAKQGNAAMEIYQNKVHAL
jgi:hypothetical protein